MIDSKVYKVIEQYFLDKPVKKVQVFGSFARNEANEKSGIDLIITMDYPIGLLKLAGYKIDLEDILHKKVDFATEPSISADFREIIQRDLKTVYERK
ncbi:MAG: nucleotidyltransferase domain-containing protein [Segetibacter sp.]